MAGTEFPLKGIIPPLVTPLADRDALDLAGLERVIDHVLAGGVHGLFVLGSTGEAPSLSIDLQRQVITESARLVAGRVPLLVGITHTAPAESVGLARHAADCGADAVVLAAPHYFPMHQQDLTRYVRDLAPQLPLPFFLYNMPSHTKTAFDVKTIEACMDLEGFAGVKDSSAQMMYYNQLVELFRERSDLTLLMGPEELLAESILMGGHGGICGGANLIPQLYVELYEAAVTGDLRVVHQLQQRVLRLSRLLYGVGAPPTGYLTGLKCALETLGICSGRLAEPLYGLDESQQSTIRQYLADLGILDSSASVR